MLPSIKHCCDDTNTLAPPLKKFPSKAQLFSDHFFLRQARSSPVSKATFKHFVQLLLDGQVTHFIFGELQLATNNLEEKGMKKYCTYF